MTTSGRRRRKRQSQDLSKQQIRILIKQFGNLVREVKRILNKEGVYGQALEIEELLITFNCNGVNDLLENLLIKMESLELENVLANAFSVKLSLLENIDAVVNHRLSFKFWRFLSMWAKSTQRVVRIYLTIELAGPVNT